MRELIGILATVTTFVFLLIIGFGSINNSHELHMAQEQTSNTLAESLGEFAIAMNTLAEANIKLAEVNSKQVELLEKQHDDYNTFVTKSTNVLNRFIIFLIALIISIVGLLSYAAYVVGKDHLK